MHASAYSLIETIMTLLTRHGGFQETNSQDPPHEVHEVCAKVLLAAQLQEESRIPCPQLFVELKEGIVQLAAECSQVSCSRHWPGWTEVMSFEDTSHPEKSLELVFGSHLAKRLCLVLTRVGYSEGLNRAEHDS